jgi:hypothetical protein
MVCLPRRPFDFLPTTILESIDGYSPTFERFELFKQIERSEQVKEMIMPEPVVLEVFSDFV